MKWVLLGLLVLVALEIRRRRRAFYDGPNYVAHLARWDRQSPQIPPAKVPKVRTRRAEKVTEWGKLRRMR